MQNNNSFWLGIGILIATVLAGGFFFMFPHGVMAPTPSSVSTTTSATASTTHDVDLGNGVVAHVPNGATITAVTNEVPPPSLTGAIKISASLPADAQAILRTQEESYIGQLKKDPTRVDLWLKLGVDRKIGGDFAGAIEAWNYVATVGPTSINYVAYGNLGDLYMNFQTNYPKAEANYKAAIAINPKVIDYYKDLYTLYSSFYKTNTSAATDIVAQGLKANPSNPDLTQLQIVLNTKAQ